MNGSKITKYVVHDHESYYDKEYSLRKMTPPQYILDPRFEHIGCAVAENDSGPSTWMDPPEFHEHLRDLRARRKRGEKVVIISHNALFDMCLMAWRFGFVGDLHVDTMSMARALLFHATGRVSLEKVAEHLGIGAKGDAIYNASGKTGAMMRADPAFWARYTAYGRNDAELCREIFKRLRGQFPAKEFVLNDMVIRMAMTPSFKLNTHVLAEHLAVTQAGKLALLDRCGLSYHEDPKTGKLKVPELMSNDKFADLLRRHGVEPPTKISLTTGEPAYAFAKTDDGMAELEEHPDPDVQALVAARLGHKSTLEESRTQRFIDIGNCDWGRLGARWMPVPLRYAGAHTHRLSGDWLLNMQNLGRGSRLRHSLEAPDGYTVVACDSSQIEARTGGYVAGQDDLTEAFRQERDIYSEFAGDEIFHRPITKADKVERFCGKQAILGLGYGMGAPKFSAKVVTDARLQLKLEIEMPIEQGQQIVKAYRRRYHKIAAAWRALDRLIPVIARGERAEWGPVTIADGTVILPSGLRLYYDDLHQEVKDGRTQWVFTYGKRIKFLYGGKLFENIVQALAREAVMNAALLVMRKMPGFRPALQVHDELVYVVRNDMVEDFSNLLRWAMTSPEAVPFAPGLPLACELSTGRTYGDAK